MYDDSDIGKAASSSDRPAAGASGGLVAGKCGSAGIDRSGRTSIGEMWNQVYEWWTRDRQGPMDGRKHGTATIFVVIGIHFSAVLHYDENARMLVEMVSPVVVFASSLRALNSGDRVELVQWVLYWIAMYATLRLNLDETDRVVLLDPVSRPNARGHLSPVVPASVVRWPGQRRERHPQFPQGRPDRVLRARRNVSGRVEEHQQRGDRHIHESVSPILLPYDPRVLQLDDQQHFARDRTE